MSILDSKIPDAWCRIRISNGEIEYFTSRDSSHENLFLWTPMFYDHTVSQIVAEVEDKVSSEMEMVDIEWDNHTFIARRWCNAKGEIITGAGKTSLEAARNVNELWDKITKARGW